jgi:hypothetical protein
MHQVTLHIHEFTRRGELLTRASEGNALVGVTCRKEQDKDEDDPKKSVGESQEAARTIGRLGIHFGNSYVVSFFGLI